MKKLLNIILSCLFVINMYYAPVMAQYYYNYYNIDPYSVKMEFVPLSKNEIKLLSKEQKSEYKKIVRIENLLNKGKYNEAYNLNRNYLPTIVAFYNNNKSKLQSTNDNNVYLQLEKYLINNINTILSLDTYELFDRENLLTELAFSYYVTDDNKSAIKILEPIVVDIDNASQKKQMYRELKLLDLYYVVLANCFYELEQYDNSYKWAIKVANDSKEYKQALEILYLINYAQNKIVEANKYAYQLYSYSYPSKFTASLRIADTTSNIDIKMKFYNIAKSLTTNETDIYYINKYINKIDEIKLDNSLKSVAGFYSPPKWEKISKQDEKLMSIKYENNRFNNFHNELNQCMSKYKGNNLKACLDNLKNGEEKISQRLLIEQQEYNRQLTEQQSLIELQRINSNLMYQNLILP